MSKERRFGIIGILINKREEATKVNSILSNYGHMIVGRMGLPYCEREISVITLNVDGTTDEIGALTGKLGQIQGVQVKSTMLNI